MRLALGCIGALIGLFAESLDVACCLFALLVVVAAAFHAVLTQTTVSLRRKQRR